ncbi:hypothetical protein GGR51DRAFT_272582 [Nemania sp. FL0031]|nr:hypothetical protein GGR51DRAFT_272582 [Nemania sp. FL0031]
MPTWFTLFHSPSLALLYNCTAATVSASPPPVATPHSHLCAGRSRHADIKPEKEREHNYSQRFSLSYHFIIHYFGILTITSSNRNLPHHAHQAHQAHRPSHSITQSPGRPDNPDTFDERHNLAALHTTAYETRHTRHLSFPLTSPNCRASSERSKTHTR